MVLFSTEMGDHLRTIGAINNLKAVLKDLSMK